MAARLHPDDVAAIARAVVELLRQGADVAPARVLLTAEQAAQRLGVARSWVYAHAGELGAVPLGDGPKPRLRFPAARVAAAMDARSAGEGSQAPGNRGAVRDRVAAAARVVPNGLESLPERWRQAVGE